MRGTARATTVGILASAMVVFAAAAARGQEQEPAPPQEAPRITSVQRQRFWSGLSVGLGWEKVVTTSGHASNPFPYRFLFRNPARSGWAISPMLGWFRSDVDADAFTRPDVELGRLTVRPFLVGVRRTWVRDRMSYDVAGAAGPSFNSFKVADGAGAVAGLGSGQVSADANVSFAWRLQGTAWHDFNDRIAVRGSIAYAWNQPEVTFMSGATGRRISQNANSVQIGFGVAYRIF